MTEVDALVRRIVELARKLPKPVIIAIDGESGAGKSTLAVAMAAALEGTDGDHAPGGAVNVVVIDGDDFYSGGTKAEWDRMTAAERVAHCIDWRRQRHVLDALRHGQRAEWKVYDWEADDGSLDAEPRHCEPEDVVILEGAYSARPELADLIDLRVLLDVPVEVRECRLRRRDGDAYHDDWYARWDMAERHYFGQVMPRSAFDLVIAAAGCAEAPQRR